MSEENPFEGARLKTWGKDNTQWRRAKAMMAAGGIVVEELEGGKVKVTQTKFEGARLFNQMELVLKGRTFYPESNYKVVANTYRIDADMITPEWVRAQMELYGIKTKDLVHQTGMYASSISELINGNRPMSVPVRALFYYYFQTKRLGYELASEVTAEDFAEALTLIRQRKAAQALTEGEPRS